MDGDWIPALVPGTAAASLRAAGRWSENEPDPIHDKDIWYRARLTGTGRERLRFEGLATLAEVWLDGVPVLSSDSMFRTRTAEVDLTGNSLLAVCFRSLAAGLARPHKRGRWRPRLATPGSLRSIRTSLLGFMPGWSPVIDLVGPYRPVTREPAAHGPIEADLRASLNGTTGNLAVRLRLPGHDRTSATIHCDGREATLTLVEPGLYEGHLDLPHIAPWWPHTHGNHASMRSRPASGTGASISAASASARSP